MAQHLVRHISEIHRSLIRQISEIQRSSTGTMDGTTLS